jgi:hypothetical protein
MVEVDARWMCVNRLLLERGAVYICLLLCIVVMSVCTAHVRLSSKWHVRQVTNIQQLTNRINARQAPQGGGALHTMRTT